MIVGIAVGGGVLLILAAVAGSYFCCKRPPARSQLPQKAAPNMQSVQMINSLFSAGPTSSAVSFFLVNAAGTSERDCSICLMANTNCITSCRHRFHRECLKLWMTKDSSCPNCRSAIAFVKWNMIIRRLQYPIPLDYHWIVNSYLSIASVVSHSFLNI